MRTMFRAWLSACLLGGVVGLSANTLAAENPPTGLAERYDLADTRCPPNDPGCNQCASDVQGQFNRAANGQLAWQTQGWAFNWNQLYPTQRLKPRDLFDGDAEYLLGIPDKHVQGFVSTRSRRFPYAGSHSHQQQGGIFLIRRANNGQQFLAVLQQTLTGHPSGVHSLGKYLVYGENQSVFLKDLDAPARRDQQLRLPGPTANFGGGLGMVRLASGDYLLVTSGPGGQDARPRYDRFYHFRLDPRNGRAIQPRFLNESPYQKPSNWPEGFGFAENLSLITECDTGAIYAIHATGDQSGLSAISGNGYWRLSRLEAVNGALSLLPLTGFAIRQSMASCSMRAAASVQVNPTGQLVFHCHGYARDPDGSTLNVLGESNNRFEFRLGLPQ